MRTALLLLATIFTLFLSFMPAWATENHSYVASGNVNVRDGAGTEFKKIFQINRGTRLIEMMREGDWSRVLIGGVTDPTDETSPKQYAIGWVHNSFIEPVTISPAQTLIEADWVDLRQSPDDRRFFCTAGKRPDIRPYIYIFSPSEDAYGLGDLVSEKYKYRMEMHDVSPIKMPELLKLDPRKLQGNASTLVYEDSVTLQRLGTLIRINNTSGAIYPWGVIHVNKNTGGVNEDGDLGNGALRFMTCSTWRGSNYFKRVLTTDNDMYLVCAMAVSSGDGKKVVAFSAENNFFDLDNEFVDDGFVPVPGVARVFDSDLFNSVDYKYIRTTAPQSQYEIGATDYARAIVISFQGRIHFITKHIYPYKITSSETGAEYPCRFLFPES